jgi:hypothetical protein
MFSTVALSIRLPGSISLPPASVRDLLGSAMAMQAWCALFDALTVMMSDADTVAITAVLAGGVLTGVPPLMCARRLAASVPDIVRGRGLQGSAGVLVFATVTGLDASGIQSRLLATFSIPTAVDSAMAASVQAACAAFNVSQCPSASSSVRIAFLSEPVAVTYDDSSGLNSASVAVAGALPFPSALGVGIGVGAGAMLLLATSLFVAWRRCGRGSNSNSSSGSGSSGGSGSGSSGSNTAIRAKQLPPAVGSDRNEAPGPILGTRSAVKLSQSALVHHATAAAVGLRTDNHFAGANPMQMMADKPTSRNAATRSSLSAVKMDIDTSLHHDIQPYSPSRGTREPRTRHKMNPVPAYQV